ncbi:MAG: hypothetical protein VKL42_19560 [Snowella sp.]|nr:hypothetical protein [Snowella sp.]
MTKKKNGINSLSLRLYFYVQKIKDNSSNISDVVSIFGFVILIIPIFNAVVDFQLKTSPEISIDFKSVIPTIIAIICIIFSRFSDPLIKLLLQSNESQIMAEPSNAKYESTLYKINNVCSIDIEDVANIFSQAFPHTAFSEVDMEKKRRTLRTWCQACPNSVLAVSTVSSRKEIVGFSIAIPLTKDTYVLYRNGQSQPWDWQKNNILSKNNTRVAYIFHQVIYLKKTIDNDAGKILTGLAVKHIALIANKKTPVVIAPRKSEAGKKNAKILGFENIGQSEKGFPLFELDLRKVDELSENAKDFWQAIKKCP